MSSEKYLLLFFFCRTTSAVNTAPSINKGRSGQSSDIKSQNDIQRITKCL